ncbi:hypothetical protein N7491_010395 [Penicillium cf. griseofulvum]|uniref:Uncharacterized protein n=1 Tax=Penicillium cf. griseofulvum TaxID=2972120 RepID=A0A9W9T5S6_9EURO|nr:hypothetical protein N7472_000727 [Penicillium cf. griseofulvum]KAJ5421950.1 hypothetical protein N7491_010395 [Penicillium cf. griseofulvum]
MENSFMPECDETIAHNPHTHNDTAQERIKYKVCSQKFNCEPPIKLARPPQRVSPRPMDVKHHQDRFITE